MRGGEISKARNKVIDRLMEALDTVTPVDAPKWVITLLIAPLFVWEVLRLTGLTAYNCVMGITTLIALVVFQPFIWLYFLFDMILITRWFFARIIDSMHGDKS